MGVPLLPVEGGVDSDIYFAKLPAGTPGVLRDRWSDLFAISEWAADRVESGLVYRLKHLATLTLLAPLVRPLADRLGGKITLPPSLPLVVRTPEVSTPIQIYDTIVLPPHYIS